MSAGVAQWQSAGFPSQLRGFDSHHPLQNTNSCLQEFRILRGTMKGIEPKRARPVDDKASGGGPKGIPITRSKIQLSRSGSS